MTPPRQTVTLSMIVKNEAHVIQRCLTSVAPFVDSWVIVDTGSTDGTQAIVRTAMAHKPGRLVERPWVDFAENRTEALRLAREAGGYSLVMDADDELVAPPGYRLPDLTEDGYFLEIDYGGYRYSRVQLVSNARAWSYRGVIHEFIECREDVRYGRLPLRIRIHHDGQRSRDPETYLKDAAILEEAVRREPDSFLQSRYTFYLAQSYRDSRRLPEALDMYRRRAEQGFWTEEVFVSLLEAGRIMEALGHPPDAALGAYERATRACPGRVEARHAASRLCRLLGQHETGCAIARPGLAIPAPQDGLFVETWIYEYGLRDEFAVNAYWAGLHRDCLDATLSALETGQVPAAEQARLYRNMRFALEGL